ncbi:unnamed protein product [Fusarium venenatum]|uniref:Uncharacterized protein n=1 Tax=Fusarium venenatum TaxID=56646 RepID=A0A2L2TEE3_9HYPO|nr:uncharacterized protein FVRRES_08416 [Fusarium venenatum]CEI68339.1 unnamed protein product [Fusarium venenatum]
MRRDVNCAKTRGPNATISDHKNLTAEEKTTLHDLLVGWCNVRPGQHITPALRRCLLEHVFHMWNSKVTRVPIPDKPGVKRLRQTSMEAT